MRLLDGPEPRLNMPDFGAAESPRKRVLWRWSLAATAFVLIFFAWQCGSALRDKTSANISVRRFHEELNSGQYEEIYREADRGLAEQGKHDQLVKFLEAVHVKLGDADTESLLSITVNTTTSGGTFTVAQYETTFAQGAAVETFTWTRHRGTLKLYGYNIQSNALVVN
jgi:hypothetical protein